MFHSRATAGRIAEFRLQWRPPRPTLKNSKHAPLPQDMPCNNYESNVVILHHSFNAVVPRNIIELLSPTTNSVEDEYENDLQKYLVDFSNSLELWLS